MFPPTIQSDISAWLHRRLQTIRETVPTRNRSAAAEEALEKASQMRAAVARENSRTSSSRNHSRRL